jgi:hypothetical protein
MKHIKSLPCGTFGASSSLKCRCDFPMFAFRGCLANWNSPSVQWGAETTTGQGQSYQLRSSWWCPWRKYSTPQKDRKVTSYWIGPCWPRNKVLFIVSSRLQIHHLHVFDYIFSQGLGLGCVARASAITPQHDSLFSLDLGWGLGRWGNNIGYMIPRKNGASHCYADCPASIHFLSFVGALLMLTDLYSAATCWNHQSYHFYRGWWRKYRFFLPKDEHIEHRSLWSPSFPHFMCDA